MPKNYMFDLSGAEKSIKLKLTKDVFPDTWEDQTGAGGCLAVPNGNVDSSKNDRLICHSGPPNSEPVIILLGATWSSRVGDTGTANCAMCEPGRD
jgi:hypothetical protein